MEKGKRGNNVEGFRGAEVRVDGALGVLLRGDVEHHQHVLVLHLADEPVVVALRYHRGVIFVGDQSCLPLYPLQLRLN